MTETDIQEIARRGEDSRHQFTRLLANENDIDGNQFTAIVPLEG